MQVVAHSEPTTDGRNPAPKKPWEAIQSVPDKSEAYTRKVQVPEGLRHGKAHERDHDFPGCKYILWVLLKIEIGSLRKMPRVSFWFPFKYQRGVRHEYESTIIPENEQTLLE